MAEVIGILIGCVLIFGPFFWAIYTWSIQWFLAACLWAFMFVYAFSSYDKEQAKKNLALKRREK